MNPVSQRLLNQQLICPQFTTPHEVVAWMGAIQAQDYKMMRWAVTMRTQKPSLKAFENDFNEGKIIRTHLFRSTWQLVAGNDLGWMLELCETTAKRRLINWMHTNGISISEAEQHKVQQVFTDLLEKRRIALKSEFNEALCDRGIVMDDHRLSYHIRLAEYAGLLCSGNLTPLRKSFSLVTDKLKNLKFLSHEEALATLARKFFLSHGPASFEDYAWWSGLNISDCRKGLNSIQSELLEERWKGITYFRHRDSRTRGFRRGTVTLLPPYDEYLIGYKSRHIAAHPDHMHHVHSGNGIFWPVILHDGEVIGNWFAAGGKIKVEFFNPEASIDMKALAEEIARYQKFISK